MAPRVCCCSTPTCAKAFCTISATSFALACISWRSFAVSNQIFRSASVIWIWGSPFTATSIVCASRPLTFNVAL